MGSYTTYIVETFVTLAIVCGLAYAVLFGARRLGLGRARGPIELVGQLPLDARRFIYLVRVGGQVYVVGAGEGGAPLPEALQLALQATRAARGAPSITGSDWMPMRRSPAIDLKSLSVMIPCAPMLYSRASSSECGCGIAPAAITAPPVHQARPS